MSDLFVYGALRYRPLLDIVLGGGAAPDVMAAELPGHAVFGAAGQISAVIEPRPDGAARGLLLRGLSDSQLARLHYYEGGSGYDLRPVTLRSGSGGEAAARAYFPPPGQWRSDAPWSLEGWVAQWGALSLRAAAEAMDWFGRFDADQIARRMPAIRLRAAAWLAAQARPADPDRDLMRDVIVHAHHRPYLNFFGFEEVDLQFRRHDGSLGPVINRGALMVGEVAVVLPYDPRRDTVLLIEQFRAPLLLSGDRAPWVWEPVAGLLEPGETPRQAALREAREEAGLDLAALEPAGQVYPSTGSSSELQHLFIGLADLSGPLRAGGVPEEGEDIRSQVLTFDDLMAGVDVARFRDLPLVATALWLARHRDRLRAIV